MSLKIKRKQSNFFIHLKSAIRVFPTYFFSRTIFPTFAIKLALKKKLENQFLSIESVLITFYDFGKQ